MSAKRLESLTKEYDCAVVVSRRAPTWPALISKAPPVYRPNEHIQRATAKRPCSAVSFPSLLNETKADRRVCLLVPPKRTSIVGKGRAFLALG